MGKKKQRDGITFEVMRREAVAPRAHEAGGRGSDAQPQALAGGEVDSAETRAPAELGGMEESAPAGASAAPPARQGEAAAGVEMEGTEGPTPEAVEEEVAERELEAELDRLQLELATLNDRHVRLAAEFENYRKRIEKERLEAWTRAQADLVRRLLDVLDDLERVSATDRERTTIHSLLEGIGLMQRKLLQTLEHAGLASFEPAGEPFDPATMEAMMTAEAEEGEADETVANVFQKGYWFKGHLVRPARVSVRKGG
ncbi:MAG: nucleotide exchange factor GrpE [Gemmatimonadetes bacterium]|nr:nucleotide exchange factor GrpE [Gemmatimonadota bacterium]